MLKFLAFGLGAGAAIQAFRKFPPDGPLTVDAVVVVFIIGLACAYLGGRSRRGASATAVAVATAEATATAVNTVNVAVVVPGQGAHSGGIVVPGDGQLAWQGERRSVVSADDLDGAELSELGLVSEHEVLP